MNKKTLSLFGLSVLVIGAAIYLLQSGPDIAQAAGPGILSLTGADPASPLSPISWTRIVPGVPATNSTLYEVFGTNATEHLTMSVQQFGLQGTNPVLGGFFRDVATLKLSNPSKTNRAPELDLIGDRSFLQVAPSSGSTGVSTFITASNGLQTDVLNLNAGTGLVTFESLATNNTPALTRANGSVIVTTNGAMFVRSNNAWVQK